MEITKINDDLYKIKSNSGNTYQISYNGSGDADPDYISLWKCNCPAGQHNKMCKHLKAVLDLMN